MGSNLNNREKESNHQLDPVIKTVLGCLDINLENELNLYRKNKRLQEKNNMVGSMGGYRSTPVPSVIIQATETETEESSTPIGEMDSVDVLQTENHQADLLDNQTLDHQTIISPSNDGEPGINSDGLSPDEAIIRIVNTSDNTSGNASLVRQDNSAVNQDKEAKETSIASNLLTPLGLLSMLLFFLSCMGLGYLLNSSEKITPLQSFNWQSWLNKTPEEPTSQPTALPTTTPTVIISVNPDLTSREFIDLDLDTLSNINPKATPIPTPSPAMTIPPVPSPVDSNKNPNNQSNQVSSGLNNLSTTLLPPPPSSPVTSPSPSNPISPPVSTTPQNSPSAQTNSPNPIPLKSNDGFYYVVTNYVDEASLQQVRTIIPDAYIREGSDRSRKIQLGAFNDEKSARRFVQELQAKGLVGQYYRF